MREWLRQAFCRHRWDVRQYGFEASNGTTHVVIAFKQCPKRAKSKLIHILA